MATTSNSQGRNKELKEWQLPQTAGRSGQSAPPGRESSAAPQRLLRLPLSTTARNYCLLWLRLQAALAGRQQEMTFRFWLCDDFKKRKEKVFMNFLIEKKRHSYLPRPGFLSKYRKTVIIVVAKNAGCSYLQCSFPKHWLFWLVKKHIIYRSHVWQDVSYLHHQKYTYIQGLQAGILQS